MNKFEKQLEKWNNGVLRGAQARLAKTLGVSTATAALWTTGKRRPSKGYVAQMALLFGMDVFGVLKLFDARSVTYPEPRAQHPVQTLREHAAADCAYTAGSDTSADKETAAQSNSVILPFLSAVPQNYPQYDESDVIEWWSVPRRYARGAKYILRSADAGLDGAADEDDLCFIKPGSETPDGSAVLFLDSKGHCLLRKIRLQSGIVRLYKLNGEQDRRHTPQALLPLGTAVRRISGL